MENFNQAKEVSGVYLKRLLQAFVSILKKPVEYGKEFVASNDMKLGVGFLAVQAILSAVFVMVICSKINSVGKAVSLMGNKEGSNLVNYPKAFLLTIIGSMIMSFAVSVLLYLGSMLFRGKTTFGKMLCVVAVRSVGISIFMALSIIVIYLNVVWGFIIFGLSWLVGLAFMIPVIRAGVEFNINWLPYLAVFVAALSIVLFYLLMKNGLPLYIPSEIKSQFDGLMDGFDKLGTLSSFL